jgi:hypothetical protein
LSGRPVLFHSFWGQCDILEEKSKIPIEKTDILEILRDNPSLIIMMNTTAPDGTPLRWFS